MKKKLFFVAAAVAFLHVVNAQTLFTYGKKSINKKEFLKAFDKNPSPDTVDRKKALKEYLDLFINYKLKVQSAYDDKLNEQPIFKNESSTFKNQLADNYINNEANIDFLIQQAFDRSQKDIHVAQIFIELKPDVDNMYAQKQIFKAYNDLKQGKNFEEAVKTYSNDESTIQAKGDLGFITAFTLPYEYENEIYNLKQGEFSAPYKSALGWHIFKNIEERKAVGKRRAAQILIAIPTGATPNIKEYYAKLADSVYHLAIKGEDFEDLVNDFSNDRATVSNAGVMPEIGIGEYAPDFEAQLFALKNKGDISKPFLTEFGWHIVKLLDILPVSTDSKDPVALSSLKQQVERTNRLARAKKALTKNWMTICKFKAEPFDEKEFLAFTDSAVKDGSLKEFKKVTPTTVLFSFEKQKITAGEWAKFARATKQSKNQLSNLHPLILLKEYQEIMCGEYYHDYLEDYVPALKDQSQEFDEANLLFAAMDKYVWNKANEDTAGLRKYYNQNKAKYIWQPGVSAIVITANNQNIALAVIDSFKTSGIKNWRTLLSHFDNKVLADSSRFENNQLPVSTIEKKVGFMSKPEKSINDESYTFVYITALHNTPETRSFDDARGFVTNDYQQVLEQKWLAALKKKYPVVINQAVWNTVK